MRTGHVVNGSVGRRVLDDEITEAKQTVCPNGENVRGVLQLTR